MKMFTQLFWTFIIRTTICFHFGLLHLFGPTFWTITVCRMLAKAQQFKLESLQFCRIGEENVGWISNRNIHCYMYLHLEDPNSIPFVVNAMYECKNIIWYIHLFITILEWNILHLELGCRLDWMYCQCWWLEHIQCIASLADNPAIILIFMAFAISYRTKPTDRALNTTIDC